MALAVANPLVIGNPADEGVLAVELGGIKGELRFPVECPGQRNHERRHAFTKNGHDTRVKGNPQQFHCKTCWRSFYPHTSGFFLALFAQLKLALKAALEGGRLDLKQLAAKLSVSKSTASRLLSALVGHLAGLDQLARYRDLPRAGKLLFVDETFLKICGEQWYIIAFRNEHGKILDAVLVQSRAAPAIMARFRKVARRLRPGLAVLVTDDFTAYHRVAFELELDLIHVRHIHAPPYGRVVVDAITWVNGEAHYTTAATANDVLVRGGAFIARVSHHVKKKRSGPAPAKRGRKPGGKNRPKEVIAAEKRETAEDPPKKRGRKDPFKAGEDHVFFYDEVGRKVAPWWGSDRVAADAFTNLLGFFGGKHITTNPIENFFEVFKKLVEFSGKRTPARWQEILDLFVVIRQEKNALTHLLRRLEFRPQLLFANLPKLLKVKKPTYRPKRRK